MSGQSHKLVRLRRFMPTDADTIVAWPTYPAEFAELDYALRKDGWLAELCNQPDTWIHVAELSGELLAFTTLASTTQGEAEFRIALRADMLGQGLGYILTEQTLAIGFHELGLQLIHLIVRKNNPRAIELYRRMNFSHCGERQIIANGIPTDFLLMELLARDFIGPMRTRSQIVSQQEEHPNNKPTHTGTP